MGAAKVMAKGFLAGALSVVTVMSAAWWLARTGGYIPATANPLWALQPAVPPLGVPRVVNSAFWGGVWGMVLSLMFQRLHGAAHWLAWFLAGAVAVAATAIFIVPRIKGLAVPEVTTQRLLLSGFLNGMFGLGAGLWLTILGRRG